MPKQSRSLIIAILVLSVRMLPPNQGPQVSITIAPVFLLAPISLMGVVQIVRITTVALLVAIMQYHLLFLTVSIAIAGHQIVETKYPRVVQMVRI
jgi:membrane protein CcdC involved in cytochrome C biogenesis